MHFCRASGAFTHYPWTSYPFLKRRAGQVANSQPTCFANDRKLLTSRVFRRQKKSTSWIYYDDTFSLERNRNRIDSKRNRNQVLERIDLHNPTNSRPRGRLRSSVTCAMKKCYRDKFLMSEATSPIISCVCLKQG